MEKQKVVKRKILITCIRRNRKMPCRIFSDLPDVKKQQNSKYYQTTKHRMYELPFN